MLKSFFVSLFVICCLGDCYSYTDLTFQQLSLFSLISSIMIVVLLVYYNFIPKSNRPKKTEENPIYTDNDILFQSNTDAENLLVAEKTTSFWVKAILYIMITIVIFTPFYELIGVQYFV